MSQNTCSAGLKFRSIAVAVGSHFDIVLQSKVIEYNIKSRSTGVGNVIKMDVNIAYNEKAALRNI